MEKKIKRNPSYLRTLAKMKERYHNDPEYRAKKIADAKEWQKEARKDPKYLFVLKVKRRERYKRKILV